MEIIIIKLLSPLKKKFLVLFPTEMPFDYQMVTFKEIIKNDFFKWTRIFINKQVDIYIHLRNFS